MRLQVCFVNNTFAVYSMVAKYWLSTPISPKYKTRREAELYFKKIRLVD